jgi:hypothetical protein
VEHRCEREGVSVAVVAGEVREVGRVMGLDQQQRLVGVGFVAEEETGALARAGAELVGDQTHEGAVHSGAVGQVFADSGAASVEADAGEGRGLDGVR